MPTVKKYAVDKHKWLTKEEFDEAVVVTNVLPGPSVVEIFAIISIKVIGKLKGSIVVIIGVLPHILLFFTIYFLLSSYLEQKYFIVVNIGAIPVVIASLLRFSYNYMKSSIKEMKIIHFTLLTFISFCFCLLVPSPYNIAAILMVAMILLITIWDFFRRRRRRGTRC